MQVWGFSPFTYMKRTSIINDEGRTCTSCKTFKIWDAFYANKRYPHGKSNICSDCSKLKGKIWREGKGKVYNELRRAEYHEVKERKTTSQREAYYKRIYGANAAAAIVEAKSSGCEVCGSYVRVQVDADFIDTIPHALCQICKCTIKKHDEHQLFLLRDFSIQQAIRKGLH